MRADDFAPLEPDKAEAWGNFLNWGNDVTYFPNRVGLELEEVKTDYCRVRLPFDPENLQPAGVVHGGAIATILDTVVVPAIGSGLDPDAGFSTIELHVQYMRALTGDAVAEGWVTKRGRKVVFTRAEVTDTDGRIVAAGTATYAIF